MGENYYTHPSAFVEDEAKIGKGTNIWHFVQIRKGAKIGKNCNLGKDVYVGVDVKIGDNVKIQNGVSVYQGVTVGDNVFLGPHMTFTNDVYPRAEGEWDIEETLVEDGVSIGAHATILSGITLGEYCMVGAGSVVTKDVPPHTLVYGNPAVVKGFVCTCGNKLKESKKHFEEKDKVLFECSKCGEKVEINEEVYLRKEE
ncbi:MAG: acyltransferase [Thermoplasmatota archaeon]